MGIWEHLLCTGGIFGGKAIELSGMVVAPKNQRHHLGRLMLDTFMQSAAEDVVTGHTRNPAVLRMFAELFGEEQVYPLNLGVINDKRHPAILDMLHGLGDLHQRITEEAVKHTLGYSVAGRIPATTFDSRHVGYHVDRYDEGGLYGQEDPAERPYHRGTGAAKLKKIFLGLENPRTALALVADYSKRRKEIIR